MGTAQISIVEVAVWVAVLVLTVLLGLAGLVFYLKNKSLDYLKQARNGLREHQAGGQRIRQASREYQPSDAAPYGRIAADLARRMDSVDRRLGGYFNEYGQLQAQAKALDRLTPGTILRSPFDWYLTWQRARALFRNQQGLEEELKTTAQLVDRLENQGWEVANQVRQTLQSLQTALHICDDLQAQGVQDAALQDAVSKGKAWEETLSGGVPMYILSGEKPEVLAHADKDAIVEIFQSLSKARPGAERLLTKAKEWQGQSMQLGQLLEELASAYQELLSRVKTLESNPARPLVWDQTGDRLADLGKRIDAIWPANKPRSLDELRTDLGSALVLMKEQGELAERVYTVEQGHTELLSVLAAREIQEGFEWNRAALKVAEKAAAYDPENWPRSDGVIKLRPDLQALSKLQQRLIASPRKTSGEPAAVTESSLDGRLRETTQLLQMHQAARPRLERIRSRLEAIQAAEREAGEGLSRAKALLNQAEMIIASNPFLSQTYQADVEKIRLEMEKTAEQLEQRERGAVDGKAQRARGLLTRAEQAGNQWLLELSNDLEEKLGSLEEKTSRLNAIAPLDEPAFLEAQSLIGGRTRPSRQEKTGGKPGLTLAEAVNELKRKSDEWQRCVGYLKAVEQIESTVVDSHEKAQSQRQQAREQLARALEVIPETRSWPPTMQSLAGERGELNKIEQNWATLAQEPIQPIRLVSRLGGLAADYQGFAARVSQKLERAGVEQNRIRELENRLADARSMWQYQMQLNADNFLARDEIHLLLDEVDKELEEVRGRFKRGGISYNQVVQHLRSLCQKLDNAQIPLDNSRLIDINGELQSRA